MISETVFFKDLGLIDYKDAWEMQEKLFNEVVERKLANRNHEIDQQEKQKHYLLFCEHPTCVHTRSQRR